MKQELLEADVRMLHLILQAICSIVARHGVLTRETLEHRLRFLRDHSENQSKYLTPDGFELYELRIDDFVKLFDDPPDDASQ